MIGLGRAVLLTISLLLLLWLPTALLLGQYLTAARCALGGFAALALARFNHKGDA